MVKHTVVLALPVVLLSLVSVTCSEMQCENIKWEIS